MHSHHEVCRPAQASAKASLRFRKANPILPQTLAAFSPEPVSFPSATAKSDGHQLQDHHQGLEGEVVEEEEAESGRDAPANGDAHEENGEQKVEVRQVRRGWRGG